MLSGIRVLDLTDERGFLAGKILGDLGADVVKVEPPGGDRAGRRAPYLSPREPAAVGSEVPGDVGDHERSLPWLALNTSKRGITLDWRTPRGAELLRALSVQCDVLLESGPPGRLAEAGVGFEVLRAEHERLIWCAISPFGQTGPRAHWRAGDLVIVAMGGNTKMTGDPDRAPVRCTFPTGILHAAPEAALGVVMALEAREQSGRGQLVDVSMQEAQLQSLLGGPGMNLDPARNPRRAGARVGRTREIWAAKDGHVSFGLRAGAARVPGLIELTTWMDECGLCPDWLREYDWSTFDHNSLEDADIARFEAALGAFFASKPMRELYEEALRRRILLAPCNDAREVLAHPQLRDRALFQTLEYPHLGAAIEHPAFFAKLDAGAVGVGLGVGVGVGVRVRRRAPRVGEHNAEVYAELGLGAEDLAELVGAGVV